MRTASPGGKKKKAVTPKDASAAPGLVVSNATWTMLVDSATMTNFQYKGNVDLPLARGGTVTMMEFTVDSMSMSNATTVISEAGQTGTENRRVVHRERCHDVRDEAVRFPARRSPHVHAVDRERSAADVANLVTRVVPLTLTDVTADQTVILAGQAQKTAVGVTG